MIMQREVEIEVESIDKGGNFIGWCFIDNTNLSVALVEEGFASSHFTAERSNYGRLIAIAEVCKYSDTNLKSPKIWNTFF